jgi:hypothetical protein
VNKTTQWNGYTFPIDYIGNGLYGVFACPKGGDDYRFLNTNKDIFELFRFVMDIAGEQSVCEMSECAIATHDLDDIIEDC